MATTKKLLDHYLHFPEEPTCYTKAAKHDEWHTAMSNEFQVLLQTNTWTLVLASEGTNVVGCKWVFRTKRLADGTVERRKACLEVVKPTTIRTILSIAVQNTGLFSNWILAMHFYTTSSMNRFTCLNLLDLSIQISHHICKLNKAIYGLKQAP